MNASQRIDVHQHIVPPVWAKALNDLGLDSGGWAIPAWSAADAIAMMDEQGIATGVLSVTAPGVHLSNNAPGKGTTTGTTTGTGTATGTGTGRSTDNQRAPQAQTLARAVNEYGAEMAKDHPTRIGSFASVPLPDVDAALEEAAYALDTLGADGVVLMSNTGGRYLGDPAFEPLWAELDRRAAVVFVHPAQPPMPLLPGTPAPVADYVFDTTRTALNMALNGVLSRHRKVKVILSHGGGFLPYAAYRFAGLNATALDTSRTAEDVIHDLKRFYFDTALAASPSSLPSLLAFAEPGHVLYGSDWPFAPQEAGTYYNRFLETYPDFAPGQAEAIDRGNAEALFPRLAQPKA
ncbi:amidohydrolase family protein [Streptomyces sp. NPDC050610]|uniref:amidohydrolase family protein n=1 Tax=Streptomyces sp. NPDC050610 TaxID=3157097 RepID=UPI003440C991